MRNFDDSDLILQKALANKLLQDMSSAEARINKISDKIVADIAETERKLEESTDVVQVATYSKELKEKQASLVTTLSIKDRIDGIIAKNKERVAYLSKQLSDAGIYDEKHSKQVLADMEKQNKNNISEDALNLNKIGGKKHTKRFFEGEILTFVDGELNFSLPENLEVAKTCAPETLTKIIMAYPTCAATIPDGAFLDVRFKQNFLKSIATFAAEESKNMTIGQVNKKLGGLLNFKTQITRNVTDYIAGVQNMLDVVCKQQISKKNPAMLNEINDKLKCNGASELLPASKKAPVLAEGMAGEVEKTEEQESEEVRKTQEQETEKTVEFNNYLEQLFERMMEIEQEEIELQAQQEQAQQQELKAAEEMKEKQKENSDEEYEAMLMGQAMTKHDD
jgi:hypothetical protein